MNNYWKKYQSYILFIMFLLFVISWLVVNIFQLKNNTLENNNHWLSSKKELEMGVMGMNSYLSDTVALGGNKLNLGAWHGYQEVIFKEPISLKQISFDFYFDNDSYFYFIFNKVNGEFSTIRFSNRGDFPSISAKVLISGKFKEINNVNIPIFESNVWNSVKFVSDNDKKLVNLYINDQLVEKFDGTRFDSDSNFGYRGSFENIYIDNVEFLNDQGGIIFEDFSNNQNFEKNILIIFIFGLIINIGLMRVVDIRGIFILNFFISLILILSYFFIKDTFVYRYPKESFLNNLKQKKEVTYLDHINTIIEDAKIKYTKLQNENKKVIMIIGTSQTLGSGAYKKDETYVSLIEQNFDTTKQSYLNSEENTTTIQSEESLEFDNEYGVINMGISGQTSSKLLELYEQNFENMVFEQVIINLSSNETSHNISDQEFKESLLGFIKINEAKERQTIFSLEANSIEKFPESIPHHKVMKVVAEENNIPIVNTHECVQSGMINGILWWDYVHPTSYGHSLISKCIMNVAVK